MTWFKVDDGFYDHPKVEALANGEHYVSAVALWTLAGSWCAKYLTDGHVPRSRVVRLGLPMEAAEELVRVGLWTEEDDGFRFYGWTEYQPTREEVEARRAQDRDRKREARAVKSARRQDSTRSPQSVRPDADRTPSGVHVEIADVRAENGDVRPESALPGPARPDPTRPKGEGGTAAPSLEVIASEVEAASGALKRAWSDAWAGLTGGPAPPAQLTAVAKLGPWLVEFSRRGERPAPDLAAALIERFFEAKSKGKHRPRVEWLAEDPGRYLDDADRKVRKREAAGRRRRADYDHQQVDRLAARRRNLEREGAGEDFREEELLPGGETVAIGQALMSALKGMK